MQADPKYYSLVDGIISRAGFVVFLFAVAIASGQAARGQASSETAAGSGTSSARETHTHMSEALRSSVKKVVVIPGERPANEAITGTYKKDTDGLVGGANRGSKIGVLSREVAGVNVSFPIPILTIPGAILGGLSGKTKREIQEFRDAMTRDLAEAANQPLTNDGLALDVYRDLRKVPDLESKLFAPSTPVPEDTDAVLYASVKDVTIEVQGKEAILTTSAEVTLRRLEDGRDLYERVIVYRDRDTLGNWTRDDNALWRDYANFARHYLGREIAAQVFGRIELHHELAPRRSESVKPIRKNPWAGISRTTTPTLAWELTLLGGDAYGSWAGAIDKSAIYYDVEVYDMHRLVYAEEQVADSVHTLLSELDGCKTYRWSVRPSYHVGGDIKYGEWMRASADAESVRQNGSVGRKASEAMAYIQDFASLKVNCGRR